MNNKQKRFQGMYWRQLFVTAGMVLLTLALMGVAFFSVSYQYARFRKFDEMKEKAVIMGGLSREYLELSDKPQSPDMSDIPALQRLKGFALALPDIRFLVCDTTGHVLLSTDPDLEGRVITMPVSMTLKVMERGTVRGPVSGIYEKRCDAVGIAVPDSMGVQTVGEVFALSVTTSLDTMWQGFTAIFMVTACAALLIAFFASSLTASRLVNPMRKMVQATRQYADGNFDIRMDEQGQYDEIGELAASFNHMAESLQRQEEQRREFISNVSHDLKTPLTTIAGYTDGILDGTIPPEYERKYLSIISDECRRLSRMVRRMLDVSQYQAVDPLRGGNHFDICESMRRVLISMERKITDRHLDVNADIPEEPIVVLGDRDMMIQVIYNLLENAVKFAAEGSTIYLGVTARDGKAWVRVRNQGETIPPEELPLLFDRFHKSDKSRSEDKDGVGLGLYIVKTILKQHREDIYVSSQNGTTEFSFPLAIA